MKKISYLFILLLLFIVVLPSHSKASNWQTFGSNEQNNTVVFDGGFYAKTPNTTLNMGTSDFVDAEPVVANNVLYYVKGSVSTLPYAVITAVSLATGVEIWSKPYNMGV